jgi:hypothetical protein
MRLCLLRSHPCVYSMSKPANWRLENIYAYSRGKTNLHVETCSWHIPRVWICMYTCMYIKSSTESDDRESQQGERGVCFRQKHWSVFKSECEKKLFHSQQAWQSGVCKVTEPHQKRCGKKVLFEWVSGKSKTQSVSILPGHTEPMQGSYTACLPSVPLALCVSVCVWIGQWDNGRYINGLTTWLVGILALLIALINHPRHCIYLVCRTCLVLTPECICWEAISINFGRKLSLACNNICLNWQSI